jgi:VWFA-related protein
MRRSRFFALLTVVWVSAAVVLFAQTPSPPAASLKSSAPTEQLQDSAPETAPHPSDAQNKIRVNSDLVVLPVTVKDQFGDLVPDLQQPDFRIFDDNVEQSMDVFTAEAFPLSLVVLIDDDLKSKDAAQMAPTLRAITAGISANDEVLICRFDLSFYPSEAFTTDFDKLWADVRDAQDHAAPSTTAHLPAATPASERALGVGEPKPATAGDPGHRPTKALDDAVHSAAQLLHDRGIARRKIILIVSDGTNGPLFNHYTYGDTREALLRDNISVYSLAVGSSLLKHKFSRLLNYAEDTGGDVYYASTSSAMERLYSQITEQARHEYTLAYVPRGIDRNSAYHKVEVRVGRPNVTVKTRQGYYISPLPSPAPVSSSTASGAPGGR